MSLRKYSFKVKIWKYNGQAGWYFATIPKTVSREIRKAHGIDEEGWGRLKTTAEIGSSKWKTAIWYDSKFDTYLLPIKAQIRKNEKIEINSSVEVKLILELSIGRGWSAR